jgi:hypothetical protein
VTAYILAKATTCRSTSLMVLIVVVASRTSLECVTRSCARGALDTSCREEPQTGP